MRLPRRVIKSPVASHIPLPFRISQAHLAGDRAVCELASANGFNQIWILVAAATAPGRSLAALDTGRRQDGPGRKR
jgi:hypothetical protein